MRILRRLFAFLRPHWKTLIVAMVLLLGRAGTELIPPLVQRAIIDKVIGERAVGQLLPLTLVLLVTYIIIALFNSGDMYVRHALGVRVIVDFRVRVYAYLQRLSLSFFERMSTGELMSRVTNDVSELEQFVTHGSALLLADLLRLVGAAVILFVLDWRLALLVILPVPPLAVALRYYNTRVRPVYRRARDRMGDINAVLQDRLSGIRVIQAFAQETRELGTFAQANEEYYQAQVAGVRLMSIFFPGMGVLMRLGSLLLLAAGALLVVRDSLTIGTLVAFLSYATSFYDPINRLTEVDNIFQRAIAAGSRVFELLDAQSDIKDAPGALNPPAMTGDVVFEHVSFGYSVDEEVLHDISFRMAPGEMVALVGPSGAGKTSIANLLCRFYDPDSGKVTVDGHDLCDVQLAWLRSHVAIVLQDTFLFNSSVRDNLLYGKPGATQEEMVAAARVAHAHDFIMNLPRGYATEIGERGVRLSGGQKQRLALARAILTDPRILILDEATSSVDAEAEYLIQQALEEALRGRTSLVIAHRLSTIRRADKIIALEDGHIREVGSHEELIESGGLYSQLYRRQLATHEAAIAENGG